MRVVTNDAMQSVQGGWHNLRYRWMYENERQRRDTEWLEKHYQGKWDGEMYVLVSVSCGLCPDCRGELLPPWK